MPGTTPPDVFVNLRSASVRTARNYHRLEHLGRRGSHTFNEETITDLLLAEMAGLDYLVEAACPLSVISGPCLDWDGAPLPRTSGLYVRALTKIEEGGNKKYGKKGVNADFVIAVDRRQPDRAAPDAPQLRMLIQAKRIETTQSFLHDRVLKKQYDGLLAAAVTLGAVPYYALYVQQSDAHTSSTTKCFRHTSAADRAIVLVAAQPAGSVSYLPGQSAAAVLSRGRPLRCLAGCACTGSSATGPVRQAVADFIHMDFPTYEGAVEAAPLPSGLPRLRVNTAVTKLTSRPVAAGPETISHLSVFRDQLLVVRLGRQAPSWDHGRRVIGYSDTMTGDEVREAARRYWRLNPSRAERVAYLVAAAEGRALRAYRVLPDGVTYTYDAEGSRRAALDIVEINNPQLQEVLLEQASAALQELAPGAQNPVRYVDLSSLDLASYDRMD